MPFASSVPLTRAKHFTKCLHYLRNLKMSKSYTRRDERSVSIFLFMEALTSLIGLMCLWYNVSCLLQLKIDIIGHMLASLGSKRLHWPTWPAWPPLDGICILLAAHNCFLIFNFRFLFLFLMNLSRTKRGFRHQPKYSINFSRNQ